ncbi:hypothetical protein O181_116356 [Austropuccinia psidii MF-1]|uniref:Tf2-1-like SH3-like domain-containing protein n=1 Tax=Austropuccinia psidii MF-1 TaxID=1389203 RepID=A0A9Q3KAL4_9BASI|nr:hypothetical protein [Austropuccinia psidii MF-1]
MRDSFLGPFTIIKLVGRNAVEVKLTEEFSRIHPVFTVRLVKPYFQTEEGKFPSRKKILKPPGIVGWRTPQDLFKNQTADKDKWLAEDAIPDGNLHLRTFRASMRTEQSHQ